MKFEVVSRAENKPGFPFAVPARSTGFTLVELMIVVAIIGVIAAFAVPAFNDFIVKNRVKSAAEDVYGLVLQAKLEGPNRDMNISLNTSPGATWCAGFATVASCDCALVNSCVVNVAGMDVLQVVNSTDYTGVSLAETFASGTGTTFDRLRGTATVPGVITLASGDWALEIQIAEQGQIRVCNPNDNAMPGYASCN